MKMNKHSLQKHKPSCRLSLISNHLEDSLNEIDLKNNTIYSRPLNETVLPYNDESIPHFRKMLYQTTK